MDVFPNNNLPEIDGTIIVQKALSAIVRTNEQTDIKTVRDILIGHETEYIRQKGYNAIKTFGAGKDISADEWLVFLCQMIYLGYIALDVDNLLKTTEKGQKILSGEKAHLVDIKLTHKEHIPTAPKESSEPIEKELLDKLLSLRQFISRVRKQSVNQILSYSAIEAIARQRPITISEFQTITGDEYPNCAEYVYDFIEILKKYEANMDIEGKQIKLPNTPFEEMYEQFRNFLYFNLRVPEIKAMRKEAILRKWYDNVKCGLIPMSEIEIQAFKALEKEIKKITRPRRAFRPRAK